MAKAYFDIGFVVPLREEFERLTAVFPQSKQEIDGLHIRAHLDLGVSTLTAVAILQDDMGKAGASRAAQALLSSCDIGAIMVVGIAGGVSGDVAVGDVCFTGTVVDVLENSKISDKKGKQKVEFNTKFYNTDPRLTFSVKYSQLGLDTKPSFEEWQLVQHYKGVELIPAEFIGRKDKNEILGIPKIHDGTIACGSVSKSDLYKSDLKGIERKMLALETESGGVFHEAALHGVPAVSIRGICDYADHNKSKLEEQTGNNTRTVAAQNAVSFVALQLSNPQFLRFLADRRSQVQDYSTPLFQQGGKGDLIGQALTQAQQTIHEQLAQLAPEYRGKPLGYRLPLPRVRRQASNSSLAPSTQRDEPVSFMEAVTAHRIIVAGIPRNFPDKSLPWILAGELSRIEIDGMQLVPSVIPGDLIRPPHGTLAAHAEIDLPTIEASNLARPVVIIEDFRASSKAKVDFLKAEFEKYPSAKFVILNRADPKIANEGELSLNLGSIQFDVCEISFVEMAQFFQRAFSMPDQQASVTALRLREMFHKFHLNAHPSYFAGVASEVLAALLRANRRSELLQLAVRGFLSFVVASDKGGVVLSPTTRELFLRRFVFESAVNKVAFDRPALIKYTEDFFKENDYDIDSIDFINSFVEKGLIHFSDGIASIPLPFIESFLLASELGARAEDAKRYFDLTDEAFDFVTFDIYAELGASDEIVGMVQQALDDEIVRLRAATNGPHILLTDEIKPAILERPGRLRAVQDRIEKAFDDVINSRPNSTEKQRLLDVAAQLEDDAREVQQAAKLEEGRENGDPLARLDLPMRLWSAGTILLGAGSERLKRDPKRRLAATIVRTTSILMDEMLRSFPHGAFDELKTKAQSDAEIRNIFDLEEDQVIEENVRELVGFIIDAYEFSMLGFPMRLMFDQLGDVAGQPVLSLSVGSVSSDDVLENLIAKVWAAEIGAAKGKADLLAAIRKLPPSPFVRITLSTWFMARVFWNHWEMNNRLALLDAAEECLKPLQQGIDKGRIIRQIEQQKDDTAN